MISYDFVVIGGGHAGIEACNVLSRFSKSVLLVTDNIGDIGKISCNPSFGGSGKSQLIKELDVFSGLMGTAADSCCTHCNVLNVSKGYSARSTRMQVDKYIYSLVINKFLSSSGVNIIQDSVVDIGFYSHPCGVYSVNSVITKGGVFISCSFIILTSGTFLRSKVFMGCSSFKGFRDNECHFYSNFCSKLKCFLPGISKFKTGTPPRIDSRTVNFDSLEVQSSSTDFSYFSNFGFKSKPFMDCWLTKTNDLTRSLVLDNINKSSYFSGIVNCKGPRYCPSLEDKYLRFPNDRNHNIFLEKESAYTNEIYVNGFSNSFDALTQSLILRSIHGLENSNIIKYAYSIEYSYFNPKYLKPNFESKFVNNIFLAGQINGTTGYEEAACQGLYAAFNAYRKFSELSPFYLESSKSYMGLLFSDLLKGDLLDPYRMFTSRSANRINIREDNVIHRLLSISSSNCLINYDRFFVFNKCIEYQSCIIFSSKNTFFCDKKSIFFIIKNTNISIIYFYKKGFFLSYISYLLSFPTGFNNICYIDSSIKYSGICSSLNGNSDCFLCPCDSILDRYVPFNFDFSLVPNLSNEFLEKVKGLFLLKFSDLKSYSFVSPSILLIIKNYIVNNL